MSVSVNVNEICFGQYVIKNRHKEKYRAQLLDPILLTERQGRSK